MSLRTQNSSLLTSMVLGLRQVLSQTSMSNTGANEPKLFTWSDITRGGKKNVFL